MQPNLWQPFVTPPTDVVIGGFLLSGGLSASPFSCPSSLCKGRTLYSVVRDAKIVLDVNKTRQIAQEIVKVWCG